MQNGSPYGAGNGLYSLRRGFQDENSSFSKIHFQPFSNYFPKKWSKLCFFQNQFFDCMKKFSQILKISYDGHILTICEGFMIRGNHIINQSCLTKLSEYFLYHVLHKTSYSSEVTIFKANQLNCASNNFQHSFEMFLLVSMQKVSIQQQICFRFVEKLSYHIQHTKQQFS